MDNPGSFQPYTRPPGAQTWCQMHPDLLSSQHQMSQELAYRPGRRPSQEAVGRARDSAQCLTSTLTSLSPCSRCQFVVSGSLSTRGFCSCTFKSMPTQVRGIWDPERKGRKSTVSGLSRQTKAVLANLGLGSLHRAQGGFATKPVPRSLWSHIVSSILSEENN